MVHDLPLSLHEVRRELTGTVLLFAWDTMIIIIPVRTYY